MIRLAVLGDVHGDPRLRGALDLLRTERLDLALLAGDVGVDPPWLPPLRGLLRGRHDRSVVRVVGEVRATLGCPVVLVPGNHDLPEPPPEAPGVNADGRMVETAGLRIAGLGGAGPERFGFPYEWSEDQAWAAIERLGPDGRPDLVLCHAPPRDSRLDRTHRGKHAGSRAVRSWIAGRRPRLFVCGHIHEAWGVEWIDGVPCLNAGSMSEPFGQEIAWIVEWAERGPERIESRRRDAAGDVVRQAWTAPR